MLPLSFPPTFAQKKKKIIMAQVKKQLTELIGHTPLLELERLEKAHNAQARIIAKLEYFNPGGSVKDRIALAMIEDAEKRGLLKEGATIIEPTSGNTGVGLAWVASVKGYKTILTMPETMSIERQNLLKALGTQLVLTPGSKGMSGAIEKANELRDNVDFCQYLFNANRRIQRIHEIELSFVLFIRLNLFIFFQKS